MSDIPSNGGKSISVSGRELAVFNIDGAIHVIDNACLHRGGPLGDGEVEGKLVTCPWHGWQYDVTTGSNIFDPAIKVQRLEVRVEDDEVWVAL